MGDITKGECVKREEHGPRTEPGRGAGNGREGMIGDIRSIKPRKRRAARIREESTVSNTAERFGGIRSKTMSDKFGNLTSKRILP